MLCDRKQAPKWIQRELQNWCCDCCSLFLWGGVGFPPQSDSDPRWAESSTPFHIKIVEIGTYTEHEKRDLQRRQKPSESSELCVILLGDEGAGCTRLGKEEQLQPGPPKLIYHSTHSHTNLGPFQDDKVLSFLQQNLL